MVSRFLVQCTGFRDTAIMQSCIFLVCKTTRLLVVCWYLSAISVLLLFVLLLIFLFKKMSFSS